MKDLIKGNDTRLIRTLDHNNLTDHLQGNEYTPDPHTRQRSDQQQQQQPKDISQIAGEMGTSLLKGAGSLWKSGREKMTTLIHDYQSDSGQGDPNVPKWMRDQPRYGQQTRKMNEGVTDEARALEAQNNELTTNRGSISGPTSSRDRLALRKQTEEEAEVGYRSSSRRRIPSRQGTPSQEPPSRTATPSVKPPEFDLFSSTPDIPSQQPSRSQTPQIRPSKPSTPKPQRVIPQISDSALSSSHTSRKKGSEAFKVGDYTLALTHYTSALTPLPSTHPQRIIILSNRAITNLKLGDAKAAIVDCDELIALVGPTRGEGEIVDDMDGQKNLKDIWGKGVLRRASALEMHEKYSDALEMWKLAVDAGIGASQSLEGRRRCESALGIKSTNMQRTTSTPQRTSTPPTFVNTTINPSPRTKTDFQTKRSLSDRNLSKTQRNNSSRR